MKYPSYVGYRSSGFRWLSEIPEHWETSKVRYQFSLGKGLTITKANLEDEGVPCVNYGEVHSKYGFEVDPRIHPLKCVSEAFLSSGKASLLQEGDLVFADTSEDLEGSGNFTQLVCDEPVFAGYHTVIARPSCRKCSRYYAYLFDSTEWRTQIQNAVKGVKVFSITQAILRASDIWLPPLKEQTQIAKFLDYETAKIDALIEKQQALIALLLEKRQAVISHAVTKGLNPDAPMRDSGVEWLGEVPAHWEVAPIKHVFDNLDYRRIPLSTSERGERQGEYDYYGASGVIDHIDDYLFDEPTILVGEDGANLVNRSTRLAFPAFGKYWVNNHAHILRPPDETIRFWAEAIEHIDVNPLVTGSAQPKLTAEALINLKVAFPPMLDERLAIEHFIKSRDGKMAKLQASADAQVDFLQERRTALISAAVTGKIDVRGWKSPIQYPETNQLEDLQMVAEADGGLGYE